MEIQRDVHWDCIINAFFNEVYVLSWLMTGFLCIFFLIPLNSVEDAFNTNLIITTELCT